MGVTINKKSTRTAWHSEEFAGSDAAHCVVCFIISIIVIISLPLQGSLNSSLYALNGLQEIELNMSTGGIVAIPMGISQENSNIYSSKTG